MKKYKTGVFVNVRHDIDPSKVSMYVLGKYKQTAAMQSLIKLFFLVV